MSRRISTRLAIEIVILAALVTFGLTQIMSDSIQDYNYTVAKSFNKKDQCQVKAYQGKAVIRVWYANPTDSDIVAVHSEDVSLLPGTLANSNSSDSAKIRLVDISPKLKKDLENASAKKPKEITIGGYAVSCNGINLASVSYQEGIFRPYLSLK